jgi:DNA repair exonuclease SbcCD nuclease subunit
MKVLVIGDPHFKVKNGRETDLLLQGVKEIISLYDPYFIVVLGDILDRHELIHQDPLKRVYYFLKYLSSQKPTYLLVGNHDRPNNSVFLTDDHPFHSFSWNNLTVVAKPLVEIIDKKKFTFVPYVEPGRFIEALNTIEEKWQDSMAIFAHQEFKGVKMGHFISIKGDEWPKNNPLVISGHIHEYGQHGNIIYVGTPFQQAFDECADKGVSLFTFDKGYKEERLKLPIPPKVTIKIEASKIDNLEIKQNQETKVIIQGSSEDLKGIRKNNRVKELISQGIKVTTEIIDSYVPIKEEKIKRKDFLDIVFSLVEEDKDLLNLAQEIYGVKKKKINFVIRKSS